LPVIQSPLILSLKLQGEAIHERFVIETGKFLAKVEAKKSQKK
jgi:hypothetical protein